eukprot:gene13828-16305_t
MIESNFDTCQEYDVIVVGAGVAGAALAYSLAKRGSRRVLCLERDLREPDRIVGELMQPGGVKQLRDMGLEDCFVDIDATLVYGYGIFKQDQGTRLTYPHDANGTPFTGHSFHHGRFVQKLRHAASSVQSVTLVQATVKALVEDAVTGRITGVRFTTSSGVESEAYAPLTVVCDGCFSNLRRSLVTSTPSQTSTFVGLIIRDCQLPYPKHGHVFLVDPSPILMYQIGSNEIRVLVDVPGTACPPNAELKCMLESHTAPQLPEALRQPFLDALHSESLKKMPNSRLHPESLAKEGVILLGDAWNMRHPLTGAGMTVALSDVNILSRLLAKANLNDAAEMHQHLTTFHTQRKPLASTMNVLAGALYKVFSADNEHLRKACLGYLSLGGEFSAGPVSLLSGLRPKPHILAMHFFAVAFYGVIKTLFPFPTPHRLYTSYKILCAASDIVVPLLRNERVLRYLVILCTALRLTKQ